MKKRMMVAAVAGIVLVGVVCGAAQANAQDNGRWRAANRRTEVMTGELTIAPTTLTIYESKFPMVPVRKLTPVEVGAVFDADTNAGIGGNLYSLHVPPGVYYAGGSPLCGNEFIRWMATYVTRRTLQVAFFSGDDVPVFTFDAIANASTLCGTYVYKR
jgi:hypothetical protein